MPAAARSIDAARRTPDGAVRAVVRDRAEREHDATCGAEAWLALLPEPIRGESPVVRLLDAAGEVVATPLPAGVELAPVEDADEPCPVCGAADWGRVVAAPEGRYGSDGAGRPTAAVCRRCGHEESLGVMYGPGAGGAVTDPDLIAELEERRARHLAAPAPSTRFPLLGLAGRRPSVVDRSQHGDELVSVTLAFDTTTRRPRSYATGRS